MFINYEYPSSVELREVNAEKIPNLERNRPTFQIFKTTYSEEWTLEWEIKDGFRGMQQLRGLNGEPSYVKTYGKKRFSAEPGVFGEYATIDEKMLTLRARYNSGAGGAGTPINIDDLVMEREELLNDRELNVIEFIHWKALLEGQFTFIGPTGAVYSDAFNIQQVGFSDWSNLATATPIKDLLSLKELSRGKSVSFGNGTLYMMNSRMVGYLLLNNNPNDLGGMFAYNQGGTKPFKTLAEINTYLQGAGLGQIVEYDEGYTTESNQEVLWIPDDRIAIIGRRTNGDALGEYRMVRNVNGEVGRYQKVIDHKDTRVPRLIEVHRGHNGGLVIFYPSAIARATA